MPESHRIIQVRAEWALEPEDMGTKQKFWYREPVNGEREWLFKHPRENTGEHWAEKIAAEVAGVLEIRHARVELAEFQEQRGSVSESFISEGQDLFHGNQLLERTTDGYDPTVRRRQSDHSFENIWNSFERIFVERSAVERARRALAKYLVLDAVIGNTDRHHENWGLLRKRVPERWMARLAPSFDHASSLGRELLDRKRILRLEEDRVGDYSEKASGQIFWSEESHRAPSPLDLVRKAVIEHPPHFAPALERVAQLRDALVAEIVDRVPEDWMSPAAREFVITLIGYNRDQLVEQIR